MAKDDRNEGDDEVETGKHGMLPPISKKLMKEVRETTKRLTEKYDEKRGTKRDGEENQHHHMPGEVGIGGRDGMQRAARANRAAGLHRSSRSDGDIPFG